MEHEYQTVSQMYERLMSMIRPENAKTLDFCSPFQNAMLQPAEPIRARNRRRPKPAVAIAVSLVVLLAIAFLYFSFRHKG